MRFEIGGRNCEFLCEGDRGPIVFVGVFPGDRGELFEAVKARIAGKSFGLFMYELSDWKRDCAPWVCEIENTVWESGAEETLEWLNDNAFAAVKQTAFEATAFLAAGYSMSGLLALWLAYRSESFCGAACCSGSLWYPGWDTFAKEHTIRSEGSPVYLSLGGKEARSGPEYMACIETRTRAQAALLKADGHVKESILEMNPGGHFTKTTERLAKGIAWIVERV